MTKKLIFIVLVFILNSNCSFDTKSGIWSNKEKIEKTIVSKKKTKLLFQEEKKSLKELNRNLLIKIQFF